MKEMIRLATWVRPTLLAAGMLIAGPAAADSYEGPSTDARGSARAPHKTHNRFHHADRARETAEFARLEEAATAAGVDRSRGRAPHKAHNRFHNVD